jgi:hypothetical protein
MRKAASGILRDRRRPVVAKTDAPKPDPSTAEDKSGFDAELLAARDRRADVLFSRRSEKLIFQEELNLKRRSTAAAESAARWAAWSIVVSLIALALAAWPYIKDALT